MDKETRKKVDELTDERYELRSDHALLSSAVEIKTGFRGNVHTLNSTSFIRDKALQAIEERINKIDQKLIQLLGQ